MIFTFNNSTENLSKDDYYDKLAEEYSLCPFEINYSLIDDLLKYENNPFKNSTI